MARPIIPPQIGWPIMVVSLLLLNVSIVLVTLFLARSDGGAQVIENYYEKGVEWDVQAAVRASSDALGWEADVILIKDNVVPGFCTLEVAIQDSDGYGVEGLIGSFILFRPQKARPVLEMPLLPDVNRPGLYYQMVPFQDSGLWDIELFLRKTDMVFTTRQRKNWQW